ncbi:MAG: hypothetical protein HXY48_09860 [Ignavibacteriaceae bacterium]|nr:hypothetical protein [Ignavibacteriaceae bacterium]
MKISRIISFALLSGLILISCYDQPTDSPVGNKPPNTGVFLYPDSSISPQPSRLRVHWWGDDPDGIIVGFYFSWDNINWSFTSANDSLFALQIGAVDTTYVFYVSAVDDGGNGVYDSEIIQNGINYGPEPFIDKNNNQRFDESIEDFFDIGLIDPTPASNIFPLKNTAPQIQWSESSFLPDTSYPVMSFGWEASDLDGDQTIQKIKISLNDTSSSNIIELDGSVRRITLRTKDYNLTNPLTEILIEGSETNINPEKLSGIRLNDNNRIYVEAVDISGATSGYITLPDSGKSWYVKKPKGKLLIVDDYRSNDDAQSFYAAMMDSLGVNQLFDVWDIRNQAPPYIGITFLQTIKLFSHLLWYSDNSPSLDLAVSSVQKYLDSGGKIAFSMQFPQSIDLNNLGSFLPISQDSLDQKTSILPGISVRADSTDPSYPPLVTIQSLFRVKSFYVNELAGIPIYYFPNKELKGFIGFFNSTKTLFFFGLPLNKCNGGEANVKDLLTKVLLDDFGLTP